MSVLNPLIQDEIILISSLDENCSFVKYSVVTIILMFGNLHDILLLSFEGNFYLRNVNCLGFSSQTFCEYEFH